MVRKERGIFLKCAIYNFKPKWTVLFKCDLDNFLISFFNTKTNAFPVATQAPLPHTFGDFWFMCWQERCRVLVALTNMVESGRRKCDQYSHPIPLFCTISPDLGTGPTVWAANSKPTNLWSLSPGNAPTRCSPTEFCSLVEWVLTGKAVSRKRQGRCISCTSWRGRSVFEEN